MVLFQRYGCAAAETVWPDNSAAKRYVLIGFINFDWASTFPVECAWFTLKKNF